MLRTLLHRLSLTTVLMIAAIAQPNLALAQSTEAPLVREMSMGPEDAPITMIEYASFTCPHCRNFHVNVFDKLKANYIDTGKVRFIVRDVYFDRLGLWASMMARCGTETEYFAMADLIYKGQKEWSKGKDGAVIVQNLMQMGRLVGFDDAKMNVCMQDGAKAQALVDEYQRNAEIDDIKSTPSFIINGEKTGPMTYEKFAKILDKMLKG